MTKNKMFLRQLDTNKINYLNISIMDDSTLWHLRYRAFGEK